MKITTTILCLGICTFSSCAINYLQLNSSHLQPAIVAFEAEDYELCEDLLEQYQLDDFILGAQHELAFMRGMSAHHQQHISTATTWLLDYLAMPGAVPARMRIAEQVLLDNAELYIDGSIRVLWLFTSPSNGYSILEDLAFLASSVEVQAQSIARTAEYYFSNKRYKKAVNYYSMLLNPRYAALGWNDRATYRFAECRYLILVPEKSDEQSIMFAINSARSYLDAYPAGLNRVEATAILDDCLSRLSQLHLTIAEYYVTIGNDIGAIHHFKLASGQESQGETSMAEIVPASNEFAQQAAMRLNAYAD